MLSNTRSIVDLFFHWLELSNGPWEGLCGHGASSMTCSHQFHQAPAVESSSQAHGHQDSPAGSVMMLQRETT